MVQLGTCGRTRKHLLVTGSDEVIEYGGGPCLTTENASACKMYWS